MITAGILGATGYAGQQLVWFLHKHPKVELKFMCSHNYAGSKFSDIYNNYSNFIQNKCISLEECECKLNQIDVLFIALPNGSSFNIVKKALLNNIKVIDLGADYRLNSAEVYKEWYGIEHNAKNLLKESVYGLPEIYREKIKTSNLIANPGCYTTASILAVYPLLKEGLIDTNSIIIDGKSGISGAGRALKTNSLFCECNESVKAYGVAEHRHTPEIEQQLSAAAKKEVILTFTPHLIPMNRGILATCYANLKTYISEEDLYNLYNSFYGNEYFIRILKNLPDTRNVRGSNLCDIAIRIDKRTNKIIVISAIDNLIKGAAGQAIQNMNIMFGIDEKEGLDLLSMQI
ncbi:N-acetyl-gamma-glutamyl-phosphate reductase [Clostridium lundense]|uniref:N-acetyl-gamma-glutamyl-phosphate reductase n=1 Tax=Clostridium lundense TaxID=319475 RepID=UPI00048A3788|nr:N-acetyl-gamma-glutamyl-phosphate reductase [Clostridium lundense]